MYEIQGDKGKGWGLSIVLSDALECVNGAWIQSLQEKGVERLNVLRKAVQSV